MKKFFKILMVLALLSGAALSCTKDYSKEIADVQKQNQDLQALVASLQNALNSTNATVSQLNSTSNKQAADIAALASANAEAFATIIADHAGDVAYLEGLIEDLKAAGATDLAAAVKELKEAIEAGNGAAAAALAAKAEELAKAIKDGDDAAAAKLAEEVAALEAKIKAGDSATKELADALAAAKTALEKAIKAGDDAAAAKLAEEVEALEAKIAAGNEAAAADLAAAKEALEDAIKAGDKKAAEDLAAKVKVLEDAINAGKDAAATALAAAVVDLNKAIDDGDKAAAADLAKKAEELAKKIEDGDKASAAKLDAAKEELEAQIKACGEEAAEALADAVTTCKEDIAKLKEALEGKIDDLEETLNTALAEKAEKLEKAIDAVKASNTEAIEGIKTILEGIKATLKEYKGLIDENAEAIATLNDLIETNQEAIQTALDDVEAALEAKIELVGARLTNIVAAPAKGIEIQTFKWKTIERTTVNMSFVVAPAEAAKAVADGFKNEDVTVVLNINSGMTRAAVPDSCDYVIIPDEVIAKDGVITVSAVVDTVFADLTAYLPDWNYYATLAVSGEDEVGPWQRVSDPVKPIISNAAAGVDYAWYAGDKAVNKVVTPVDLKSDKFGVKDSVVVYNDTLIIVKKDWDWKSETPLTVGNIIAGFTPKYVVGSQAYTAEEFWDAFKLPDSLKITAPRFVNFAQTFTDPKEWADFEVKAAPEKADSALFKATTDSTITGYGFSIVLPENDDDKVEVVGKATIFTADSIAFSKVDSCKLKVKFVQRIGKHVKADPAVEKTLEAKFGIANNQASVKDTTFSPVSWVSTTQIGLGKDAVIYNAEKDSVGNAAISINGNNPKFVDVHVKVPYAKDEQKDLKIVLKEDAQKNSKGVVVVEYGEFINLTVEPYHPAVIVEPKSFYEVYAAKKVGAAVTIKTDKTIKDILGDYHSWLEKDGTLTAADSTIVEDWFTDATKGAFKSGDTGIKVTQETKTDRGQLATTGLSFINDTLNVIITDFNKFKEGKEVVVEIKDTIDGVNAFKYTLKFEPKKPGVKVKTIPGYVQVIGGDTTIVAVGEVKTGPGASGQYEINDVNLYNCFKIANFKEKFNQDNVQIQFVVTDTTGIIFTNTTTGDVQTNNTVKSAVYDLPGATDSTLASTAKISWGALRALSFNLQAKALLAGTVVDSIEVKVSTKDPIKDINDVEIDTTITANTLLLNPIENVKVFTATGDTLNTAAKLGIYGATTGPAVNKTDMSDWTCKVNGADYDVTSICNFDTTTKNMIYTANDLVGTIEITIPCKFEYKYGIKKFNVKVTIIRQ